MLYYKMGYTTKGGREFTTTAKTVDKLDEYKSGIEKSRCGKEQNPQMVDEP